LREKEIAAAPPRGTRNVTTGALLRHAPGSRRSFSATSTHRPTATAQQVEGKNWPSKSYALT